MSPQPDHTTSKNYPIHFFINGLLDIHRVPLTTLIIYATQHWYDAEGKKITAARIAQVIHKDHSTISKGYIKRTKKEDK